VVLSGNQALDPAGIASYVNYRQEGKRYGLQRAFFEFMLNDYSKTIPDWGIILSFNLIGAQNPGLSLKIKLRPLMHLGAKRLTAKYRASKMFLLPNPF
jgi:hypothetical protein